MDRSFLRTLGLRLQPIHGSIFRAQFIVSVNLSASICVIILYKLRFGSDHLKFAKVNAAHSAHLSMKYNISLRVTTKQLPTVILFQHGKEVCRTPEIDSEGKVTKMVMSGVTTSQGGIDLSNFNTKVETYIIIAFSNLVKT